MGRAIIPIDLNLLKTMFVLPESYTITDVWAVGPAGLAYFSVRSDELPETEGPLTKIKLDVEVEYHPQDPTFKKITTIPRIQKALGKDP